MANHRAQPRHRTPAQWWRDHRHDTAPPALAYLALALGAVSLAACWLPPHVTLWTGTAGMAGIGIGMVGIWTSRQILSGVGVVLAGVGVVVTVLWQHYTPGHAEFQRQSVQLTGPVVSGLHLEQTGCGR